MFDFIFSIINEIRSYFVPEKQVYEVTGECKKCGKCCNYMYSVDTYTEKEAQHSMKSPSVQDFSCRANCLKQPRPELVHLPG